jgi:magnesium transporter
MISAQIVSFFNDSLSSNLILAMFMPIVIYIADAAASQVQILFARNIINNNHCSIKKYLLKEINISLLIALITSLLFFSGSYFWQNNLTLSLALGLSLMITIFFAIAFAIIITFLLNRFKKDPTIGGGPFGTIVTDILSLAAYLSITTLILELF